MNIQMTGPLISWGRWFVSAFSGVWSGATTVAVRLLWGRVYVGVDKKLKVVFLACHSLARCCSLTAYIVLSISCLRKEIYVVSNGCVVIGKWVSSSDNLKLEEICDYVPTGVGTKGVRLYTLAILLYNHKNNIGNLIRYPKALIFSIDL